MKSPMTMLVAAVLAVPPAAAVAQPGPAGVQLPPLAGFGPPMPTRRGNARMIEMVPPGQTPQRYDRIVNVTLFTTRPGVGSAELLRAFTQQYLGACPRAQVQAMNLGGGNSGARLDCVRHPRTGRAESVFARVVMKGPNVAIAAYQTNYLAMPGEAGRAREFLGRIVYR